MNVQELHKRSGLWYLLPIFLGVIGGVIAYFVIRTDDPKKAKNCLLIGIVLTGLWLFFLYLFLTYGFAGDSPDYKISSFCSSSTQMIIEKYGMNKDMIAHCQLKSFMVDGKSVEFLHLEYGKANDCVAGCTYSTYCAIVEDGIDYPYGYSPTIVEENILNANFSEVYGTPDDFLILTGREHSLTSLPEFNELLRGEFRACTVPNVTIALSIYGSSLSKQGKYQEAIDIYDKALAIEPDELFTLTSKCKALNNLSKYQEAIDWCDKALVIKPDNARALELRDTALEQLQKNSGT